jgi:hypothetical protein
MAVKLYPFCPGLVLARYRPYTGSNKVLVNKTLELIRSNQMVVITGSDKFNFDNNCQIGKSTLARKVRDRLVKKGQSVLWINVQYELYGRTRIYKPDESGYISPSPRPLKPARDTVCFIDEAQWLFFPPDHKFDSKTVKRQTIRILDEILEMRKSGIKIVFITPLHPMHPSNLRVMVNRTMVGFFIAPVIELDSLKGPKSGPYVLM